MSGHRQAAAALHGLDEQDRSLILEQLPAADQATLRGYLAELNGLGFESAGMRFEAVPRGVGAGVAGPGLSQAAPAAMLALLEHEPASLVAQLLAVQEWPWQAGLLALCTPARREAIRAASAAVPASAPARARFLLESLTARLADAAPPAAPAPLAAPLLAPVLAPLMRLVRSWQR